MVKYVMLINAVLLAWLIFAVCESASARGYDCDSYTDRNGYTHTKCRSN